MRVVESLYIPIVMILYHDTLNFWTTTNFTNTKSLIMSQQNVKDHNVLWGLFYETWSYVTKHIMCKKTSKPGKYFLKLISMSNVLIQTFHCEWVFSTMKIHVAIGWNWWFSLWWCGNIGLRWWWWGLIRSFFGPSQLPMDILQWCKVWKWARLFFLDVVKILLALVAIFIALNFILFFALFLQH
jgi:hypothetical protein